MGEVAFFGTPHRGSDIGTWTATFAQVLSALSFNTSELENLKDRSPALRKITKSFVDHNKVY
jgi:hypothetical protein